MEFLILRGQCFAISVILVFNFIKHSQIIIDLSNAQVKLSVQKEEITNLVLYPEDSKSADGDEADLGSGEMRIIKDVISSFGNVITKKIGRTRMESYEIKVDPDVKPVKSRRYQCNLERLKAMGDLVNQLIDERIVTPNKSDWSSPAFLVSKKKPGKYRLVCAYQAVNEKIEFDQLPVLAIDKLFQNLKDARLFSSMDLNNAYFQLPLSASSRKCTAFNTPFGLYEFTTISQGIRIESQALARFVEEVLEDLKFKCVLNFADDLVIYSPDQKTHACDLREVLTKLRNAALTVNPDEQSNFWALFLKKENVTLILKGQKH